jgi:hypothetical protein
VLDSIEHGIGRHFATYQGLSPTIEAQETPVETGTCSTVPKGFEAGEKQDGINEFAARKLLGRGFVSIFRVAVPT